MTILILNWRDIKHPLSGGAEISLTKHAQYWQEMGESIIWFSALFRGGKEEEIINRIKIIRKGNHYTFFLWFFIYYIKGKFKDIDIIIDCFHFIPFFTPLYIRRKKIIALINEVAGKIWFENLPLPFALVGYKLEPFFLRLYKNRMFITGSESAKNDLVKSGIPNNNIEVIHHGFTQYYGEGNYRKEKYPQLIFVGRISKDKGIEDAIKILVLLKKNYKNIGLWVVGKAESGEYLKNVKELIKDLSLQNNCKLFGFIKEEKKYELLQKAWILIHPSIKEGWGLNVIEANSVGTPAVGYNVSGLVDSIKDKRTGLLVEEGINNLYEAVKFLIDNKIVYKTYSKNAIEWARTFDWEKSGQESYKILINTRHEN